jgi:hypothetical protein
MTITRTFCSASLLALATIMGPVARAYASEPCCDWVYGKYINLKTGKEVKPPKGAVALSATAIATMDGKTFADALDRAIDRSKGPLMLNAPTIELDTAELKKPFPRSYRSV